MEDKIISLNAAKDLYCRICMESNLCYRLKETCKDLRLFDKLPPVTPKTGHWINIDDIESECSECGHREPNERFIFEDINFCTNCGTRMG